MSENKKNNNNKNQDNTDMLIEYVKELADIMKEKNLFTCTIKNEKVEISLTAVSKKSDDANKKNSKNSAALKENIEEINDTSVLEKIIASPIVGTFYKAPAENKPPYVNIGDRIEKGQTLCIIESMKLMNEVPSEIDGTIAEIYVEDGQSVEFGQKLFRVV